MLIRQGFIPISKYQWMLKVVEIKGGGFPKDIIKYRTMIIIEALIKFIGERNIQINILRCVHNLGN